MSLSPSLKRPIAKGVLGLAVLVIGVAMGVVVTSQGADATGELWLDEFVSRHRPALLVQVAQGLNVVFGPMVAPVVLLVICVLVARRDRYAAVTLGVVTVVGWLSVAAGKLVVARHRPPAAMVHALVRETGTDSYPSGHTAFVIALVIGSVFALRVSGHRTWWAWLLGVPLAVFAAVSRLVLGAHYLADVIGSSIFVLASVLLLEAVVPIVIVRWPVARRWVQPELTGGKG